MSLYNKPDPDQHKITPAEAGRYVASLGTGDNHLTHRQVETVKSHMAGYMDVDNPANARTAGIHSGEAKQLIDELKHDPNMHLNQHQLEKLEHQTDAYVKEDKKKPFSLF